MNGSGSARTLWRLWFVLISVLVIAVLYLGKVLLLPLAFAVLFAFLLAPLVGGLERTRLPRPIAALVVILTFAAIIAMAGWVFFTQLVAVANDLPTYRNNITQKLTAMQSPSNSAFSRAEHEMERLSEEIGIANTTAEPVLNHPATSPGKKPLGTSPDHPVQVKDVSKNSARLGSLGGILEPMATAFLSVVFTFFVLLQREDLRNRVIRLSGDRNVGLMTQAMKDASRRITRYFSLQLLVNFTYGCLVFTALWLIGLPHALLFGALAGICRFIPYVGAPFAAIVPTLLSLAVFHGWEHSVLVVAVFLVLEIVTANYAEPHIYGRHTGLSSLAVLVAAAFWTLLWGPVGLVLSMPLTVCLVVIGRHVPSLEFLTVMLGDEPVMAPHTCFYQRLLARDEREAGEILETCLKDERVESIFDAVLVPALILSEQDRVRGELDDASLRFIRQTTRELIEELSFRDRPESVTPAFRDSVAAEHASTVKVLCVPVRDEIDELGALMLTELLQEAGIHAIEVPERHADITTIVREEKPDVVYLSGMPPVAMARAHRLYRALRSYNPDVKIMIGLWNYGDDVARAARKITGEEDVHVATTLADALAQVRSFAGLNAPVSVPSPELTDSEPISGRSAA